MGSKDNGLSNTPILVVAKVIKDITGSAAEAGVAAIHINEKGAAATRRLHPREGVYSVWWGSTHSLQLDED